MNILYHFRVKGHGVERVHIAGIAEGFRALGHAVRFVSPMDNDPTAPAGHYLKSEKPLARLAERVPQWLFELMELGYNLPAGRKLVRAGREQRPDLIYERYAFFNLVGLWAAGRLGVPLIVEVNELSGYDRVRAQVFVRAARRCERRIFAQASLVVTVSDFLRDRVLELTGGRARVITVPNGVSRSWVEAAIAPETAVRLRSEWGLKPGCPVVGFVGGFAYWHRFDFLLDVFKEVQAVISNVVLFLIGAGPLHEEITAMIAARGLADSVRLVEPVPHDVIRDYFELFDVAVVPHSNEFRSPVKLFEYMGTGRAVVAPNTAPIASVVTHNHNGWLFDPLNHEQCRAGILSLLQSEQLRRNLGAAAMETIRARYLWEQHAERILEALTESGR